MGNPLLLIDDFLKTFIDKLFIKYPQLKVDAFLFITPRIISL